MKFCYYKTQLPTPFGSH